MLSCSKLIASFINKLKDKGLAGLQRKTTMNDPMAELMKEAGYGYKDGKFQKL